LGALNEKVIWDQYYPAISIAGKNKFQNFTEENIQAFYRLKLQSIENKISAHVDTSGGDGDPEDQIMKPPVVSQVDMPAVEQRLFKIEQQIINLHNVPKPKPVNLEPINLLI
jgi:hypothetical protein